MPLKIGIKRTPMGEPCDRRTQVRRIHFEPHPTSRHGHTQHSLRLAVRTMTIFGLPRTQKEA